jgi:hypothetical protein
VIDFFDRFDGDTFTNSCKKKPIKKSKKARSHGLVVKADGS